MRLGVVLMVVLDGASLTIDALAAVAEGREEVALAPAARDRMAAAREVVEEALRLNVSVYGLTTALAERKSVVLDAAARRGFSRFLIGGHRIAQGPPAPLPVVRADPCWTNAGWPRDGRSATNERAPPRGPACRTFVGRRLPARLSAATQPT